MKYVAITSFIVFALIMILWSFIELVFALINGDPISSLSFSHVKILMIYVVSFCVSYFLMALFTNLTNNNEQQES